MVVVVSRCASCRCCGVRVHGGQERRTTTKQKRWEEKEIKKMGKKTDLKRWEEKEIKKDGKKKRLKKRSKEVRGREEEKRR